LTFNEFPELRSTRLHLTAITVDDAADILNLRTHEKIYR